jgi:hypothetical protein
MLKYYPTITIYYILISYIILSYFVHNGYKL